MRLRLIAAIFWAALCLPWSACGPGRSDGADVAKEGVSFVPRQRTLPPEDRRYLGGMNYDPADVPLALTSAGDLLIAHVERYSSHDVVSRACTGSGFYRVRPVGGPAQPILAGKPACQAAEGSPAVAGDGAWAIYSAMMHPNNSGLVRLDLATGRADTLPTGCRVYLEYPSLSPDERSIAAVGLCRIRGQETYGLYTLSTDGSELREIVADEVGMDRPAWSPDGRWVAYVHAPQPTGGSIVVVGADGEGARVLAPGTGPAWSPDGRWIAFVHMGGRWKREIHLIRPDGTDRRVVFANRERGTFSRGWGPIPEGVAAEQLVWSPDSRWISFARGYDAGTSIWRVEVETGNVQRVTRPGR